MTLPTPLVVSPQRWRAWLNCQFRVLAIVVLVLMLTTTLLLILKAAGDVAAASSLRGLVWLLVVGLTLDLVALLLTTALAVMSLLNSPSECQDEERPTS